MKLALYFTYSNVSSTHFNPMVFRDETNDDMQARKTFSLMLQTELDNAKKQGKIPIDVNEFELHKVAYVDDVSGEVLPLEHYVNCPLFINQ